MSHIPQGEGFKVTQAYHFVCVCVLVSDSEITGFVSSR